MYAQIYYVFNQNAANGFTDIYPEAAVLHIIVVLNVSSYYYVRLLCQTHVFTQFRTVFTTVKTETNTNKIVFVLDFITQANTVTLLMNKVQGEFYYNTATILLHKLSNCEQKVSLIY